LSLLMPFNQLTNCIDFNWYPLEKVCKVSPPAL